MRVHVIVRIPPRCRRRLLRRRPLPSTARAGAAPAPAVGTPVVAGAPTMATVVVVGLGGGILPGRVSIVVRVLCPSAGASSVMVCVTFSVLGRAAFGQFSELGRRALGELGRRRACEVGGPGKHGHLVVVLAQRALIVVTAVALLAVATPVPHTVHRVSSYTVR